MSTNLYHTDTHRFLTAWRKLAPYGQIPRRTAFSPNGIADLAPGLFVAGLENGRWRFRLAGETWGKLFGRELRGELLQGLFTTNHQKPAAELFDLTAEKGRSIVFTALGRSGLDDSVRLEVAVAPLLDGQGNATRIVGFLQTSADLARFKDASLLALSLKSITLATGAVTVPLTLAATDGKRAG